MARRLVRRVQPEPEPEPEQEEDSDVETLMEWKPVPLLYNVADTCFILGKISKQKLYRLINDHQLSPNHVGTRLVFTRAELERYVDDLVKDQQAAQPG